MENIHRRDISCKLQCFEPVTGARHLLATDQHASIARGQPQLLLRVCITHMPGAKRRLTCADTCAEALTTCARERCNDTARVGLIGCPVKGLLEPERPASADCAQVIDIAFAAMSVYDVIS